MMKEIYSLVSETESKSDYSREINEIDKKISDIKNARSELINMRALIFLHVFNFYDIFIFTFCFVFTIHLVAIMIQIWY